MGRFPRKCKLRGPSRVTSGVTSGYPPGTLYISPEPNCENPAKSGKIWAKSSEHLSNLALENTRESWRELRRRMRKSNNYS